MPQLECRVRWVLYATKQANPDRFAEAVRRGGSTWKPVAVDPARIDVAVRALQPEAIIIEAALNGLVGRAHSRYGSRRFVIDDGDLPLVSRILAASAARTSPAQSKPLPVSDAAIRSATA